MEASVFFVLILFSGIFLLPTFIAHIRKHHKFGGILFLNIILGWTGLAWVLLLAYAVLSDVKTEKSS